MNHLEICPPEHCTGCGLCANACERISMELDAEGFWKPKISEDCIECGKCRRLCPENVPYESENAEIPTVYAGWAIDESLRYNSASGGVFAALAKAVLEEGGVVAGVAYDASMNVGHVMISRAEELSRLQSSKYVQSNTGMIYREVRHFLETGRSVLFSGTPCQVAALYRFLGGKRPDNLLTCDLICHGVPSPGLWQKYLEYLSEHLNRKITGLNMRSKICSWHTPAVQATFAGGESRIFKRWDLYAYVYGFLHNITLQLACYHCRYTRLKRCGDLTLGDFWYIGEKRIFKHDTSYGISAVLVNNDRGKDVLQRIAGKFINAEERSLEEFAYHRPNLKKPFPKPKERDVCLIDYSTADFRKIAGEYLREPRLKSIVRSLIPARALRCYHYLCRRSTDKG